jgi:nitrogen regulatory protein A
MSYPFIAGNQNQEIQEELDSLCKITTSDFSGLAWIDQHDSRIRWLYVSGNSNDRYKRLALKPGRGLAGLVLKLGRPIVIDAGMTDLELSRVQYDYPIMLVEHLQAAIAVPITVLNETRGVLLIGNRTDRYYEENDLHLISNLIERFELLLH